MTPQITGRTQGLPATLSDYKRLFRPIERPHKFSAQEVSFGMASGPQRCGNCRHFFTNGTKTRYVCEIMRLPGEAAVPSSGICRFWNQDGKEFPLYGSLSR